MLSMTTQKYFYTMKKIIILLLILAANTFNVKAQIIKASLQASGLTCSMCNLSVKKALQKLPFVGDIQANVETAVYTITFKEGQKVELIDTQKAVKKAGFSVSKLIFTGNFSNIDVPQNNQITVGGNVCNLINSTGKKLNGNLDLMIVNKDFVSEKEFKKYKSKVVRNSQKQLLNVILI